MTWRGVKKRGRIGLWIRIGRAQIKKNSGNGNDNHQKKLKSQTLSSDTEKHPIIKASDSYHTHFSSLPRLLEKITLDSNDIASIHLFYDAINIAIMTMLSAKKLTRLCRPFRGL